MGTGQAIVVGTAVVAVAWAYGRWIAERIAHPRGRLAAERNMFLLVAPISVASVTIGVAFWSVETALWSACAAFCVRPLAARIVMAAREIRRRLPVKPEDRRRRIEERAARRRARARDIERYGPVR